MWKQSIIVLMVLGVIGCQKNVPEKQDTSFLGATSQSILIFDLKGKIYRTFPEGIHNGSLNKYSEKNIIYQNSGIIKKLNIETGETEEITNGYWPCYAPKHDAFLFYQNIDPFWLFIKIGDIEEKLMLAPDNFNLLRSPIMISPDEAAFVGENTKLWIYNYETRKMRDTAMANCIPILFLDEKNQLVCSTLSEKRIFLWSINDNSVHPLKLPKNSVVIGVNPGQESLLIWGTKWKFPFGERYPIMRYSLLNGKTKEIFKNHYITSVIPIELPIIPEAK